MLSDLVGCKRSAWDLDHGTDLDVELLLELVLFLDILDDLFSLCTQDAQLLMCANKWDHDLGDRLDLVVCTLDGCFNDRTHLH